MDLKVILDATPEHIGKRTIKHVNQRRLSNILCVSVRRNDSRRIAPRMIEKYPLRVDNILTM